MARIDWNSFKERTESQSGDSNGVRVGYFSLKNDQDEAVVRFMHDTPDDFDLLVVHKTQDEQGKWKSVNCLRNPSDPIDMCPICADGGKPDYKIFVHMIEYVRQEDGTIKPLARVWERSSGYAKKLANLMAEYGPLSDCLFKVKRNGAKGNLKTEYDIMYLSEKVYPNNVYVKDTTLFENYQALGHAVLDKSYEELANGTAPVKEPAYNAPAYTAQAPSTAVPTYQAPSAPAVPAYQAPSAPVYQAPAAPAYEQRPARTYEAPATPPMSENGVRPRRVY